MKNTILVTILFTLVSCASGLREYSKIDGIKKTVPHKKILNDFPYVLQEENYCGPATLSMAFKYYGEDVSQKEISGGVFLKDGEGTYQTIMTTEIKKRGHFAITVNSFEEIVKEVSNDSPVIVFHNLGFDWYPLWHYAIVYGYDLDKKIFYVHSADEKAKKWEMDKFERSWRRGDYWGVVVNPVDKIAVTGSELDHMRSAAYIEAYHSQKLAKIAYKNILKKWPSSIMANIGLGNIYLKEKKNKLALKHYKTAEKLDPTNEVVKTNLSYLKSLN